MKFLLLLVFLLQGCAAHYPPMTNAQIGEAVKQCNDYHLKVIAYHAGGWSNDDRIIYVQCAPP